MSLVVKRFQELIGLVDQLLDALTRGIRGLARNQRPHDGERECRRESRNANPYQRARQIAVALVLRLRADLVNVLGLRRLRQVTRDSSPLNRRIRAGYCPFAREWVFSSRIAEA